MWKILFTVGLEELTELAIFFRSVAKRQLLTKVDIKIQLICFVNTYKPNYKALAKWEMFGDQGLTLETQAFESLYGGQFTLSTQLIKPNYLVNTSHRRSITFSLETCPSNHQTLFGDQAFYRLATLFAAV